MSDYTKLTNFTAKDALPSGNAGKVIKGVDFDAEFDALVTAVNSKANATSLADLLPATGGTMTGLLNTLTTSSKFVALSSATINLALGEVFSYTLPSAQTFIFSNPIATSATSSGFILQLTNGGSAAVTWPASVKWPSGSAPTLTAAGIDVLVFVTLDNGATWRGALAIKDSK